LYNAIDYKDVNGSKKKFVNIKEEVNFDKGGKGRGGGNETIGEKIRKLKGAGLKTYSKSKENSADNSQVEIDGSEESHKEKTVKPLKNNSDFGRKANKSRKTDTDKGGRVDIDRGRRSEMIKERTNKVKTLTGGPKKQKENISKRANEEVKKDKNERWEIEGVSDDDMEEIVFHKKQRKHSNHKEDDTREDKKHNRSSKSRKDNKQDGESKSKKKYSKEFKSKKEEDYESEECSVQDSDDNSRKILNSKNKTSNKYRRKRSEEVSESDSYDEGEVHEVNKKSILDKFIFFGKDSHDFFSSEIVDTNQTKELKKTVSITKNHVIEHSKKPYMLNHKDRSLEEGSDSRRGEYKEQIVKHPFLKKGSLKAIPFGRTGPGVKTRSQDKLEDTKKVERTSSPTFAYYPKTIVSKPLLRRCGENIKFVYY
jgi:hypothetical protein